MNEHPRVPAVSQASGRRLFLIMLMTLPLSGCYIISQGAHFLTDQLRARPTGRAMEHWPQYAEFIMNTEAVREYGIRSMGLRDTKSYTTFVRTDHGHLAYVVSAARPTSFERHLWRYPVVGAMPYRGFYRETAALREARRLEAAGWETMTRRVGAFSSLGYFVDPLYSYMSMYPPERIASLLLHEMTHATIWVSNDVPLNEAIANFVGDRGALAYLAHRYGTDSPVLEDAIRRQSERARFTRFMQNLARELEAVYDSGLPEREILELKARTIAAARERFAAHYDEWFSSDAYRWFLEREINNAYVDLYRTYNDDMHLVEVVYESVGGDLHALLSTLAAIEDSLPAGQTLRTALEVRMRDYAQDEEEVVSLPER